MISGPHSRTFLVIGRPRRPDKNGEIVSGFPDPAGRLSTIGKTNVIGNKNREAGLALAGKE